LLRLSAGSFKPLFTEHLRVVAMAQPNSKDCVLGALCVGGLVMFGMSLVTPPNPEKPFIQENKELRADNTALTQKIIDLAKQQVEDEKKRSAELLKGCGK
jgi:hypothetical protein